MSFKRLSRVYLTQVILHQAYDFVGLKYFRQFYKLEGRNPAFAPVRAKRALPWVTFRQHHMNPKHDKLVRALAQLPHNLEVLSTAVIENVDDTPCSLAWRPLCDVCVIEQCSSSSCPMCVSCGAKKPCYVQDEADRRHHFGGHPPCGNRAGPILKFIKGKLGKVFGVSSARLMTWGAQIAHHVYVHAVTTPLTTVDHSRLKIEVLSATNKKFGRAGTLITDDGLSLSEPRYTQGREETDSLVPSQLAA